MTGFFEDVTKKTDEGSIVDIVNMDFDEIPHDSQVWKVRSHGIDDELTNWIQNWLESRDRGCW